MSVSTDLDDTRGVVRHLGGESAHRSFFGGQHSTGRIVSLGAAFLAGLILTPMLGWPGLLIAVVVAGVAFAVTARTHRGSILDRHQKKVRWRYRVQSGTDAFVPYDVAGWGQAQAELATARGRHGRWEAARQVAAIRALPDGADGMGWLQMGRGAPGIAWHHPIGEAPYLSVVFQVSGQLRGIEAASVMRRAAEGWGQFLASRAAATDLAGDVQISTRVLPSDTALQEFWVLNALDPEAPGDAIASYDEVLRATGEDAMVQRHYVTLRWPLTTEFRAPRRQARGRPRRMAEPHGRRDRRHPPRSRRRTHGRRRGPDRSAGGGGDSSPAEPVPSDRSRRRPPPGRARRPVA